MTSRVPALPTAVMGSKKAIEDTISIAGAENNNALHKTYLIIISAYAFFEISL